MADFVQTKLTAKVKLEANNLSGKTSRTLFAAVIYYDRYYTNHGMSRRESGKTTDAWLFRCLGRRGSDRKGRRIFIVAKSEMFK